jgi:hypothetical protein
MRGLSTILLIAQASACFALIARGLARKFPLLLAYLAFSFCRGALLASYSIYDARYRDLWLYTLPFVSALQVGAVFEAYRRSLEELPGAQRITHWGVLGISICAAAIIQIPRGAAQTVISLVSQTNQVLTTVLTLSMVGMAMLFTYLRPIRRPNAVAHERILAAHFCAVASTLGLVHSGTLGWPSYLNEMASISCCVAWAVLLTSAGEVLPKSGARIPIGHDALEMLRSRVLSVLRGI